MNPVYPYTSAPTDHLGTLAMGSFIFMLLMMGLSLAGAVYFFVMPLLIYLRLGRIARATETSGEIQKQLITELKDFKTEVQKNAAKAAVQTTLLNNLDQNLAMAINKALPKS